MAAKPNTFDNLITRAAALEATTDDYKLNLARIIADLRVEHTDKEIAPALVAARVKRAYPGATEDDILRLGAGSAFKISPAGVSQYGTTIAQMNEAQVPITSQSFRDWFRLTSTGGTAKARKQLIDELPELTDKQKLATLHSVAFDFTQTKAERDNSLTLEKVEAFLQRVSDTNFGTDTEAVFEALSNAAASLIGEGVEQETVAA